MFLSNSGLVMYITDLFPSQPNEVKKVANDELDRFWYELQLGTTKIGKDTYIITLGKNNHYVIDGEVIVQYWIYKVTPDDIELLGSEDNTELMIKRLR
jgi:hypothetical protein